MADLHLGEVSSTVDVWTTTVLVETSSSSASLSFKLDSGAAATVCNPKGMPKPLQRPDRRLIGPGNTLIPCMGMTSVILRHGNHSVKENIYVVKGQQMNLLSKRACEGLRLLKCTVDSVEEESSLFKNLGSLPLQYKIELTENAEPYAIFVPRPVHFPLMEKTKQELDRMLQLGVIEEASGPTEWCSPMVVVPKGDTVRVCSDLTRLNKYVRREVHPKATVEESLDKLSGGSIFSKLDANSGFWQISLAPESVKLTAFLTPFGRFVYKKLMFGLSSAPEVFCKAMTQILEGCEGVVVHMDDMLIMGRDKDEHDKRLKVVLQRLESAGMTLNKKKCAFSKDSVNFLGYVIDKDGIRAGDRVKGIK